MLEHVCVLRDQIVSARGMVVVKYAPMRRFHFCATCSCSFSMGCCTSMGMASLAKHNGGVTYGRVCVAWLQISIISWQVVANLNVGLQKVMFICSVSKLCCCYCTALSFWYLPFGLGMVDELRFNSGGVMCRPLLCSPHFSPTHARTDGGLCRTGRCSSRCCVDILFHTNLFQS